MASTGNEALFTTLPRMQQPVRVALIKTAWNAHITNELEAGALRILEQAEGVDVKTYTVPGAVEIPFLISQLAQSKAAAAQAYIALACVIKGDTPHFDYVCQSITQGITQLNLTLPAPVIYGVLTVNNEQQALERLGGTHGHKGEEAAITAMQMMAIAQKLQP